MTGVILGPDGRPYPSKIRRSLRATYDAAMTNEENRLHWANADSLSPDSSASKATRTTLRKRARYETGSNSYARGIVNFIANDAVGARFRLQLLSRDSFTEEQLAIAESKGIILTEQEASFIESEFAAWCEAVNAYEHMRIARAARCVDGEAFIIMSTNEGLSVPVKLALYPVEADQVTANDITAPDDKTHYDGIHYDTWGNPLRYDVLESHPGDVLSWGRDYIEVDARYMVHMFVSDRPGQRRGLSDLTPALPLFAQLRRWTLAVLAAAETAADLAGILHTNGEPGEEADAGKPFEEIPIARRMLMTLPEGYDLTQFKAEQPTSTYEAVKREIIAEISRALEIPVNIALGDSSRHNYSSARLDNQGYLKTRRVDRARISHQGLDPIFREWLREAIRIRGYLPDRIRALDTNWTHTWNYDGDEYVDPQKEANATRIRLDSLMATFTDEWAKLGYDWREQFAKISRERETMAKYGISMDMAAADMARQAAEDEEARASAGITFDRDPAGKLLGIRPSRGG